MATTKGSITKVRRALYALAFVLRLLTEQGEPPGPENTGGATSAQQAQLHQNAVCRCGRGPRRQRRR